MLSQAQALLTKPRTLPAKPESFPPGPKSFPPGPERLLTKPEPPLQSEDPTFFFDFVDPASYLVGCILDDLGAARHVEWQGFEVRPPPEPMIDPRDDRWAAYQARMSECAASLGVPMAVPAFVPWTRKAHELVELAREKGSCRAVRRALFHAHFVDGADIGRVDFLAGVAAEAGLDGGEALAALGVDRWTDAVTASRAEALARDVTEAPVLAWGARRLEGFRSPGEIARWLENVAPARKPTGTQTRT